MAVPVRKSASAIRKAQDTAIPYTSCFECVPAFDLLKFEAGDYPGLISAEVVRSSTRCHTILCWRDRSWADTYEQQFRRSFGLGPPLWSGQVARVALPEKPLLQRVSLYKAIGAFLVGAAAVFGGLTAIRDYFGDIFGAPSVAMDIASSSSLDYASGAQMQTPVKFWNLAGSGRATIRLEKAELRPESGSGPRAALSFDRVAVPQLAPGQEGSAIAWGAAPTLTGHNPPAAYTLKVAAAATEGWVRGPQALNARRLVRVWADRAWKVRIDSGKAAARIGIMLYPGKDFGDGVKGQVYLGWCPLTPDVVHVDCCAGQTPTRSGNSARLVFQTGALKQFREMPFVVAVVFERALTAEEWRRFESNVSVYFE